MSNEENAVAVREDNAVAVATSPAGTVMSDNSLQMTIEQAQKQIGKELAMYELAHDVVAKLLTKEDKYYMSQLSCKDPKDWKGPKPDEVPVLKKRATDKLLSFFKIMIYPEIEEIDGGYKVTVIGNDRKGGYIGTGQGICTCYEKKYKWVKASDDEYNEAPEDQRRINTVKGYNNKEWKNKQIMNDPRAIAHTLTSMAEKRARAAFVRKLLPGLDDVSFEGEKYESDFQYNDEAAEPSESSQVMTEEQTTTFYENLKKKYTVTQIKEGWKAITTTEKLGGTTHGQSLDISTWLTDKYGSTK